MKFWPRKPPDAATAETASLRSQLDSAKRRITALTLENIQLANELQLLASYRKPERPRPLVAPGKDMPNLAIPANSEIGLLYAQAAC